MIDVKDSKQHQLKEFMRSQGVKLMREQLSKYVYLLKEGKLFFSEKIDPTQLNSILVFCFFLKNSLKVLSCRPKTARHPTSQRHRLLSTAQQLSNRQHPMRPTTKRTEASKNKRSKNSLLTKSSSAESKNCLTFS